MAAFAVASVIEELAHKVGIITTWLSEQAARRPRSRAAMP
jgi:hypothetical protein